MKAAAVQIAPDLTSAEGTVDRVCRAITDAAAQGVEIAVFPETFVPYYPYFSFVEPPVTMGAEHLRLYENAVTIPGWVPDVFSSTPPAMAWCWSLASMSATTARFITPS